MNSWKDVCSSERNLYYENAKNETLESGIRYAYNIMDDSKSFVKCISSILPSHARVLDLASSGVPWFSYLCAENNMQTVSFDIQEPLERDIIAQKGIRYIQDDIDNLGNHDFSDFDMIYCRNFSPPQKLENWYDQQFVALWGKLLDMINENGSIYWIQMTNGTGKADVTPPHFINHTAKYFINFFKQLGVDFKITKYGYMSFKVARRLSGYWNGFHIGNIDEVEDLFKTSDYSSLIKWYALQLQSFYEQIGYDLNHKVEIIADTIPAIILRVLLLDNFRFYDATIIGNSEHPRVKVGDDEFILSNIGPRNDKYFLIDGQEDKRFTEDYLKIFEKYSTKG